MLLSMAKVQIIGTKRCQDKAVRLLYRLGVIQIDDWSDSRALSQERMALSDEALQLRQSLTYASTRIEAVLAAIPALDGPPVSEREDFDSHPADWSVQNVEADLAVVGPLAQTYATRHYQLEEQLASFGRYEATLQQLLPLVPGFVDLEHFVTTVVWVEHRYQAALEIITRQLEELTAGQCEVISREVDHDTQAAVLVFPVAQAKAVAELLGRENITQLRLPTELADQPFQMALATLRQRLQAIPRELAELETQGEKLARAWRPRLLMGQNLLRDQLAQVDISGSFGQTDYTFVIEGWVPERRLADLRVALSQEVGDEIMVADLQVSDEEKKHAPIVLDNPFFAKPFEPLVGLLALPKYGTLDPTLLMSLFFPLFFGMILGDVAYGAILLVLMFYLRRRLHGHPTLRNLSEALIMGSVWSIIFGFLYGEFLGPVGQKQFGMQALWFDRGPDNIIKLFALTIGVGAGHVVLGLSLGLWGALRRRSRHQALEKGSTLVALCGLFMIAAVIAQQLPSSVMTPATGLVIVGLVILIYSLGDMGLLLGPLELIGTVSNILSYLRIAAIGLSSVYLAEVASVLAGVGNVLVGILIATFFHALNLALGAFAPTIHSLRLHYVEFFSKFYEGGGQTFRPFQRSVMLQMPPDVSGRRR